MRRHPLLLAATLALTVGCQAVSPTGGGKPVPRPKASAEVPANLAPGLPSAKPLGGGAVVGTPRTVAQTGEASTFVGKAKLLSDSGGSLVSNNSGNVLSDHGAGIIANNGSGIVSNNSGGLVSNNSGSLTGKTKYALSGRRLQAAEPRAEALLAEAVVEVLDAQGRVLVDEAGMPLTATTGMDGAYQLKAVVPAEALVLRVRLANAGTLKGGELKAIVAKDGGRSRTADLDTAATLGTSYVLDTFVKGQQAVLDKLPAKEAEALHLAMGDALTKLDGVPAYDAKAALAAAERLRGQDEAVKGTLARIEAILLAGQAHLGVGLAADSVALVSPAAVVADGAGGVFIAEEKGGRIRRVLPDGTIGMYADEFEGEHKLNFAGTNALVREPDGSLLVSESDGNRVRRLRPDGRVEVVAGNGESRETDAFAAGPATAMPIRPRALALRPDGTLLIGERGFKTDTATVRARIVAVAPDGSTSKFDLPDSFGGGLAPVAGLAALPDGTIWVLGAKRGRMPGEGGMLVRREPSGTWTLLAADLPVGEGSGLAPAPGGGVYAAHSLEQRVYRYAADGTRTLVAGTGDVGGAGDGGPATAAQLNQPRGLHVGPDGTLYVVESGSALVRAIAPNGVIRRFAGASGLIGGGDALRLAMNVPGPLVMDPDGRLVIAETGGDAIKRLEGGTLTLLAGGAEGFSGDGGPARQALIKAPDALAMAADGTLWIGDSGNDRIRRIRPDGVIETLAGAEHDGQNRERLDYAPRSALSVLLSGISGLALAPDGSLFFSSPKEHLGRLTADGRVQAVAGKPDPKGGFLSGDSGDSGPARDFALNAPRNLAFRPGVSPPELFFLDLGNCRLRKIVDPLGAAPRVETVAGKGTLATLAGLDVPLPAGPVPAADALLALPTAFCFDAQGDVYLAEAGTSASALRAMALPGIDVGAIAAVPARIRKVALSQPGAPVTILAGPGGKVLTGRGDDGVALVLGMVFDREGRLVVSDAGVNQLKLIPKEAL